SSRMPSNFRWKTHSGPVKRSSVSVAAIGSSQSGILDGANARLPSGAHRFDAEGDNRRQRGSVRARLDLEPAVHITKPLPHAEDAKAGGVSHVARVEAARHAAPEILNLQHRLIGLSDETNDRLAAAGVTDHVAEPLLDD